MPSNAACNQARINKPILPRPLLGCGHWPACCCFHTSAAADRKLQQQFEEGCPAGCNNADGGCFRDPISENLKCKQCLGSLITNSIDGSCGCPAGQFFDAAAVTPPTCTDCPKGSFCVGGQYDPVSAQPRAQECGPYLTTAGQRATSSKECGELCLLYGTQVLAVLVHTVKFKVCKQLPATATSTKTPFARGCRTSTVSSSCVCAQEAHLCAPAAAAAAASCYCFPLHHNALGQMWQQWVATQLWTATASAFYLLPCPCIHCTT